MDRSKILLHLPKPTSNEYKITYPFPFCSHRYRWLVGARSQGVEWVIFFSMRKSFIIHRDSLEVLSELSNEQKGILFQAISDYQEGKELELDQFMRVVFMPFKKQFERDNLKYDAIVERNKSNGRKGGRPPELPNPREPKETENNPVGFSDEENEKPNPKKADSDNKNKNKNKSKSDLEATASQTQKKIEDKVLVFKESLLQLSDTNGGKYPPDMIEKFFNYWSELNKSRTKMRWQLEQTFEVEKRLVTWASRDKSFNSKFETEQQTNKYQGLKRF